MACSLLLITGMGIKKASNVRREGRNPRLSPDPDEPGEDVPTIPEPKDETPPNPAPRRATTRDGIDPDFALRDTDPRLPLPDLLRRSLSN